MSWELFSQGIPYLWCNFCTPGKLCAPNPTSRGRRSVPELVTQSDLPKMAVCHWSGAPDRFSRYETGDHNLEDILLLGGDVCLMIKYLIPPFQPVPLSQDSPHNRGQLLALSLPVLLAEVGLHQVWVYLLNQRPFLSTLEFSSLGLWVRFLFLDYVKSSWYGQNRVSFMSSQLELTSSPGHSTGNRDTALACMLSFLNFAVSR